MTDRIPLCAPSIGPAEHDAVRRVLESGWLTNSPYNEEFESAFAEYLGVRHAVSLNSCASALQLAIESHGITGEVLVPSFTFVSSANAIVRAGATPVFVDVDPITYNMDPAAAVARIGARTEAILPVHFGGQTCDMSRLAEIADRYGLVIIENSAATIGGMHHGQQAGSFGTACFSFFPTNNLTTCEGGLLATDDDEVAERVRILSGHGFDESSPSPDRRPWRRSAVTPGYNMRMSSLQAAMGVQQLDRVDELNVRRREHAAFFDRELGRFDEVETPQELPGNYHVYQMYALRLVGVDRDATVEHLRRSGIDASVHFDPPVHEHDCYRGVDPQRHLPVTEELARSIMTLPMFPELTVSQLERIVASVEEALVTCADAVGA